MVIETYTIVALVASSLGAVASTIQGKVANADEPYSLKKLASALISSVFFAWGIVNITGLPSQVDQVGLAGLFIANAILGYGIDQAHAGLDRVKKVF